MEAITYEIDLAGISGPAEFHQRVRETLPVPDWYGENLDALHDVLTEHKDWIVRFDHIAELGEACPRYVEALKRLCRDCGAEISGQMENADRRDGSVRIQIEDKQFDEERALYFSRGCDIRRCTFAGPADGESALKESRDITLQDCSFSLRYPLWHVRGFIMERTRMDEKTRAAIWYAEDGVVRDCRMDGIKAVRECRRILLENCKVMSQEFGWKSSGITLRDSEIESEYIFLDSRDIKLEQVAMKGKYSFQYVENLEITNCVLDTKDAFWHSNNVTVKNSIVKGEYLAWFSNGLTLENCKIIGTQPLCYCTNLKLINCTMEETDLSFEYSDVEADIKGNILSVKNPASGCIVADSVGEVIRENPVMECIGKVVIRETKQEL